MIILKHLTVEHFRLLRRIDLHFPQRGSILIQGPNEAGKSTLFESIYFALYGEPLISEPVRRDSINLDELISYGEKFASVTLTISVGATELTVTGLPVPPARWTPCSPKERRNRAVCRPSSRG